MSGVATQCSFGHGMIGYCVKRERGGHLQCDFESIGE